MMVSQEEKTYGMLAHLLSFAGFVVPFGNIIGPLVLWLLKDELPFVDRHGKESLIFRSALCFTWLYQGSLCIVLIGLIILPAMRFSIWSW